MKYPKHKGGSKFELSDASIADGITNAEEAQAKLDRIKSKGNESAYPVGAVEGYTGLTKLEKIASEQMASPDNPFNAHEFEKRAEWAVKSAKALLKKLEDTDERQ